MGQISAGELSVDRDLSWAFDGKTVTTRLYGQPVLALHCEAADRAAWNGSVEWLVDDIDIDAMLKTALTSLHAVFCAPDAPLRLCTDAKTWRTVLPLLIGRGIGVPDGDRQITFHRDMFWQQPTLWLRAAPPVPYPLLHTLSNGRRHPQRPPRPAGIVYERFIPALDGCLCLRTLDPEHDLPLIHDWMNKPRVARFWEEAGTLEQHRAFVEKVMSSPHTHPLIGSFNGKPFGYFEAYWAKEDRIAPFYDADDYDRGVHMLVGDDGFRGPHRVAAWLASLVHYLFLNDVRTRVIVCEPRWDNATMIGYLRQTGFAQIKHFDFPHKRAALLMLARETFFGETAL